MKKFSIYLAALSILAIMSSCDDFLNTAPGSQISEEDVYTSVANTELQIRSIYDLLGENRSYRKHLVSYLGVNTDIEMHTGSLAEANLPAPTGDRKTMAVYNMRSNDNKDGFMDTDGRDPYSRIYTGIERANLAIAGIEKYNGTTPTNAQMANLLGEALTWRSFFYNDLIKIWGDVPLRLKPVSSEDLYIGPSNRDEIYEQIIADLERAEELMAWPGQLSATQTVGRPNKAFVKGLKARVCLMYAGYSLRDNDDAITVYDTKKTYANSKIVRTVSDEKREELYTKARQACLDVINQSAGTKYTLSSSFEQIFKDQCNDVMTVGRESMFELNFRDGARGEYMSYLGFRHEFSMESSDAYATTQVKNEIGIVPSFFYDYNVADVRRNVTAQPYKWVDGRTELNSSPRNFYLAKWRPEWASRKVTSNDDGFNFCVMRYADILLMYAEADNELTAAPSSTALQALKDIRNRSISNATVASNVYLPVEGSPSTDEVVSIDALTKEQFFRAIVQERAYEFAGENIRKWDLMRWGMLSDKIDDAIINLGNLYAQDGRYADVPNILYWRNKDGNPLQMEIYGLNRGETDELQATGSTSTYDSKKEGQLAGVWFKKNTWITGSGSDNIPYLYETFRKSLYKRNPDQYQLFPIMQVIITNSQGKMTNKYDY